MEAVIVHEEVATYRTSAEVLRLVREFEACTLPRGEWTHHAHLTVGLWYLLRHDAASATRLIRDRIKCYNEACGVETTPTSGYHETITLFYVWAIGKFLAHADRDCTLAALANLLVSTCGERDLPLAYYSRERLISREARTRWVEPDLKSLE
ncbi:MAG TPA: hypothetical protein VGC87_11240 [Pyrinomonadaceae bacterium]|jgi:hypothetical protein